VELPAVPGTDDVLLAGELEPAAGLIRPQILLDARDHLALTDRAAVVRAEVLVGQEPVALPEDAELERIDPQHAIAALRKLAELADHDLVHRFTPLPCSSLALRRHSLGARRYHICRSKKLISAARMIAQIAVTASVALTGSAPNGGSSCARSSAFAA